MQQLAESSDEDGRLDGYMCLGYVYEDRGADLEPDFDKALGSYRRASLMAPNGVTFINFLRAALHGRFAGFFGYAKVARVRRACARLADGLCANCMPPDYCARYWGACDL